VRSRYLITGAQGFVGRFLTGFLLCSNRNALVTGVGRSARNDGTFTHRLSQWPSRAPLPAQLSAQLSERFAYEQLSILDLSGMRRIVEDFRPACVFHLASALHSDPPEHLIETNIRGTICLFEAIAGANAPKPTVILGSSAGVYGVLNPNQLPVKETAGCEPIDVYGITKLASEHISRLLGRRHGIPVIVARIFNIVGPGQDERHVCGRMAALLSINFNNAHATVTFRNLETTRDFIDVRDVVRALLLLAAHGEPQSIYNVATGVETPIRSVLTELVELTGFRGHIAENFDDPNSGVPRSCADVSRLRTLGFQPKVKFAQSLLDLVDYYREIDETR